MTKFELYVNNEDKLTLDLFLNEDSEFSMNRIVGAKCYGIISEIRNQKILKVTQSANKQDLTIYYENCILNVNEINVTLFKRGAVQIGNDVTKYLENKKRRELEEQKSKVNNNERKPLKVKRKNKYGCLPIVAFGLALFTLLSVLISKQLKKDNSFKVSEPSSYSIPLKDNYDNLIKEKFEVETGVIDEKDYDLFIEYEDRSQTEKARITKAYYQTIIEKYSKMYGLDPRIVLGIATQERGIHSEKMDPGGATGLMQIQNSVWVGQELTAYNYEEGKNDTVKITEEDLSDVFKNIRYGCMIFQNCINQMDNNMIAAIQCYNMGYGNMMKIFKSYSSECGKNVEEILADFEDYDWLEHRNIIKVGDQKYLEHVFSWMGAEIDIVASDVRGTNINLKVTNKTESKSISIN